jgi:Antitoxin VbhA
VAKGVAAHDQEAITESERAERQRRVEDAIHSNEMEGHHVNADTLAGADEYVAGRIDSDELVARARARYGLG